MPASVPAMAPALTMKGVGFGNIQRFVEERTHRSWDEVLSALDAADRRDVLGVVAVGWYDVALFGRLLRAVDKVCGAGDLSLMPALGAFECEQDFNRVLRLFLRVLSPTALMRAEARLWRHFQSDGHYRSEATPDGMVTTLRNWATDPALCEELGGYLRRLVAFTVPARVTMEHELCRARGDDCCRYRFSWAQG